ncbi:MAG TPA: 2OG-Fe(II) oxygenase [Vicinamibacterales bacterium]|nr:2OG-Fe(II) oxygenase [Vicinamibacterales bacterium]
MATVIFVAEHAMDEAACRRVREAMNEGASEPAEILGGEIEVAEHERRASHIEVSEQVLGLVEACLDSQREAIGAFFGRTLRSREGPGLLRYATGGFYGPHVDRAEVASWPQAAERAVAVVLFLESSRDVDAAGGFSGGLLRVYGDGDGAAPVDIVPTRGTLVAFPADTLHEVTTVLDGTRDIVVDWFRESRVSERQTVPIANR